AHARRAIELSPASDSARGNLLATYFLTGDLSEASELAAQLASSGSSALVRSVGRATFDVLQASLSGSFHEVASSIASVMSESAPLGLSHYSGVALLDLALVERAQGDRAAARRHSIEAIEALSKSSAV